MKNSRKFLMGMVTVFFVLLAACGNSPDDVNASLDNDPQNNDSTEDRSDDSTEIDLPKNTVSNTDNSNSTATVDPSKNDPTQVEDSSAENTKASLKEEYLKKLNNMKKETDDKRNNPPDESTYALKNVEGEIHDIWDGLLNEIYGVLKQELPQQEMEQLREAQRKWLNYRDRTALEASLKYKGGTMEHLEYAIVLNNLTEARCFKLVEDYMEY
ncbi:lysozyme inhibitor LprI family protein [Ureibacillus aquaedulcis]|uniref:Lysozyme inhibitor LprI family protein n=1 Tax=Ureibacillus aquaedulcis TaxID=3058421 RepID=A0ABT8GKG4_9BACL|nr:lysozyme inhibitor LprI family protein [Ureibacillus sp. BA0131]MDN4491917.1 lysozyme inhibitor LprI family protein [Ureibacillus sp. BA0131]